MRLPIKTFAAAVVAAAIPLAGPAAAAPLSPSQALNNAAIATIEQVQYRRWDRGYYNDGYYNDGYHAYGAAPEGYYAYGAAPGYPVAPRYRYRSGNYGNGSSATGPGSSPRCDADRGNATSYPSWMCR